MTSYAGKPLVFLRVSSPDQHLTNQRHEVSSFLSKQGVTDAVYVETVGSTFRRIHPELQNHVHAFSTIHEDEYPSCVVFAAVDRVSRNYEAGVNLIATLRNYNIPVLFVRTPSVDITTQGGWNSMLELMRASEIEAQNISARAKAAWELRRSGGPQKRDRDADSDADADAGSGGQGTGSGGPSAKRMGRAMRPTTAYMYTTLTDEQKLKYYYNVLYVVYLLGHENAILKTVLTQIKLIHTKFAPELLVEKYGLRTGKTHWSHYEVFVGSNEDFANILNSYNLGPAGPNMHDRWSAENIEDLFNRVLDTLWFDTKDDIASRRDFVSALIEMNLKPHYLPEDVSAEPESN